STSVFPFILFIVLVSKVVVRLNESGKNIKTQTTNKQATFQKRSLFQSMFLKEIRKFFSVPIYALNTGIGLIMLLMISVGMIAFRQDVMLYLYEIFQLSSFSAEAVSVILIGFCIGMVYTSAISLSLEGKQFWIIKSLPIDAKKVMLAKIAFNIFLQLSIGLVGTILLGIGLQLSIWSILALLLFTISYSIFSSIAYAWVNLFLPKFDFINETEVVKQSLASLVSIFGGFATIALIVWGIIELSVISNPGLAVFLFALLIIALSTLLYRVVMVFCERVFTKLQA
ncbi:MAG: hypothetical protein U1C51_00125, partial [Candidatus Izemoplasmatales bacterium]|nr:hypothetical protein [Candidatus Izemoplasmatales bacterium]